MATKGLSATYRVKLQWSSTDPMTATLQLHQDIQVKVSAPVLNELFTGGVVDTTWINTQLLNDSAQVELYILNYPFELGLPVGSPRIDLTTVGLIVIRSCDIHNSARNGQSSPPGCIKLIRQFRHRFEFPDKGIDLF